MRFTRLSAVFLLLLTSCASLSREPAEAHDPVRGEQVFRANCASCHGERGRGDGASVLSGAVPAIPNFTDPTTMTVHTPTEAFTVISEGRLDKLMPPWGSVLSEIDRWAAAAYVISLRAAPIEAAPMAEVSGVFRGQVLNGTAGGDLAPDTTVALHGMDSEMNETLFELALVQPDGSYQFENVPIRADYAYMITALHRGAVFTSDVISGDPSTAQIDLPVTVYDTTSDPAAVTLDVFVLQIAREMRAVRITQVINVANAGDHAFIPDEGLIPLPENAEILNRDELIVTQPILPGGDHLMRVVYTLPYSGTLDVSIPVAYPLTSPAELMLAPDTFVVSGEGWQDRGGGVVFGHPVEAGGTLSFTLTDPPAANANDSTLIALALAVIGGGLVGLAGYGWFKMGRR